MSKHRDLYGDEHKVTVMVDKETGQRTVHYDLDMFTPAQARALAADLLRAAAAAEQPLVLLAPVQSLTDPGPGAPEMRPAPEVNKHYTTPKPYAPYCPL